MNLVRATHQLAMDTNALAELSKAKGHLQDAKDFYQRAYELEKKAAFMTSHDVADPTPHFILLRSAAALAYKSGQYEEAEKLIEISRSKNPPNFIKNDLGELSQLLLQNRGEQQENLEVQLEGFLTQVNADENEITIRNHSAEQLHTVIVPQPQLIRIIKEYWLKKVSIQARKTTFGIMILQGIEKVA